MELHVLHKHGWSLSAIAREYGLNWRTVKRVIETGGVRRTYPERAKPTELTASQLEHLARRLVVHPGIRGTVLYREVADDYGYAGSYTSFVRHLREVRPLELRDPEIRFETDAGVQTQGDWALLGLFPVEGRMVELNAYVAILGCSRKPAFRFALDRTRQTTLDCVLFCQDNLGGVTKEYLTDRDPAFCVGATSDGKAILAPEWVDLCEKLGMVPRACRPYRAKTKGKVERMVRELKEDFLAWLSGQPTPLHATLSWYDAMAARWVEEVIMPRRHRTTGQVVAASWAAERPVLRQIPARILAATAGEALQAPLPVVLDLKSRLAGDVVEVRDLTEYEAAQ